MQAGCRVGARPTSLCAAPLVPRVGPRPFGQHRPTSPAFKPRLLNLRQQHQKPGAPAAVSAAAAAGGAALPAPTGSGDASGDGGGLWSRFTRLAATLTNLFPVFVLGAAVWALARPAAFEWFDKTAITPALAVTMLGMGLTLTFEDFKRVLTTPGRIFAGFALQYTIMPLMAWAVSRLANLPLAFTIGLCIVGSCPGGTASNVVTYLARADVTLSVAMTTASTLGAVVATPLLTQLLLGSMVPVDAAALVMSTLQVVLLPVVAGAAINTAFPKQVAALAPLCALSAVVLIALICGSVMAQNAAAVIQAGPKLLACVFALHAGGFFLGYVLSKVLGIPERAARTNSIEVGMQNSALGALLASVHFPAHPLAAVPCAISACMHSIMGSLLAAYWRTQPTEDDEPTAAAGGGGGSSSKADGGAASSGTGGVAEAAAVPRNVAEARRWIASWRGRHQGAMAPVAAPTSQAAAAPAAAGGSQQQVAAAPPGGPPPAAASPATAAAGAAAAAVAASTEAMAGVKDRLRAWRVRQDAADAVAASGTAAHEAAAAAPPAAGSPAQAAAAEARAWIAAWRSKQGGGAHDAAAGGSSEGTAATAAAAAAPATPKAPYTAQRWQQLTAQEMDQLLGSGF